MSGRVVITDRALSDLREIRDYIAARSPANAAKFLERLLEQFDVIEASPESFATAPEDEFVPSTLHQIVVKPYRVLYRVANRRIEILHIRHGARLPAKPDELR
jgi:plasmid stabilization system protein ParE